MNLITWGEIITNSFVSLSYQLAAYLPYVIGAIFVFIVGWMVAVALGWLTTRIIKTLKVDKIVKETTLKEKIEKAGIKLSLAEAGGWAVKWFLVLVFLMAAADILKLTAVSDFLNEIISYVPNIVVAIIILVLGFLIAEFLNKTVRASVKTAGIGYGNLLASIAKWAVIIFAVFMALEQLGVAMDLVKILFSGFVIMMAIAGGLAFGLGGKDLAEDILSKIKKDIKE